MTNTSTVNQNTEEVKAEAIDAEVKEVKEVKVPLYKKGANFVVKHKKHIATGAVALGGVVAAIAGVKMYKGNTSDLAEAVDDLTDAAESVSDAVEEVEFTNF